MRFVWRKWTLALIIGVTTGSVVAQAEKNAIPPAKVEEEPFTIDQVIHPVVAKLPKPEFVDEIVSIPMAISSRSDLASKHVLQGLAYIQAAWDFEAYRHFCEAVRADPDCLMAYWGIGLALAAPNIEFSEQRQVAVLRMIELMDSVVEVGEGANKVKVPIATPMERQYALALAELFALRGNAQKAFKQLATNFPNNLQAQCLAIYLQRDGYDAFGSAKIGQERAIEELEAVVNENPDNVGVLGFWAMLHAEAPEATTKLRMQILPVVRKMARKAPDFPPYQHLLGHFEWRCGNHYLAELALSRASKLYGDHMKKHKLSLHECEGWIRCQLYLATAMHSRGKFDQAIRIAKYVASLKVDPARLGASGANLVLWEARTLPARLYLARGQKGDFDAAIASLPAKDDAFVLKNGGRTLSTVYIECMAQYLECRKALEARNFDHAHERRTVLAELLLKMEGAQGLAVRSSSISEYVRAVTGLKVYAAEARGLVALATATTPSESQIARSWFKTAAENQQRPSLLMPPVVVSPMEIRIAEFYTRVGDDGRAATSYQQALQRRPNDLVALHGYRAALQKIGRDADAQVVSGIISAVTSH